MISDPSIVYFSIPIFLTALIWEQVLYHPIRAFRARIQDRIEVEALIAATEQLEPRVHTADGVQRPENFEANVACCKHEADRLLQKLGPRAWTEISVVPLQQNLAEFLKTEDLKAEVDNVLTDLNDYATSAQKPYDISQYTDWKNYTDDSKERIRDKEEHEDPLVKDRSADALRAQLKVLYDYLAGYNRDWSQGSAILSALQRTCVLAIPFLLLLALTPACHSNGDGVLSIKHWAVLGIVGALTAVVYQHRNSDLVEIGNTEGTGELRQAVGAAALGLVAGSLTWSLIAAGVFGNDPSSPGSLVPNVTRQAPIPPPELGAYVGKSLLWGIAAGFSLQRVFGRLRAVTFGD